jgi:hypothetical protein
MEPMIIFRKLLKMAVLHIPCLYIRASHAWCRPFGGSGYVEPQVRNRMFASAGLQLGRRGSIALEKEKGCKATPLYITGL